MFDDLPGGFHGPFCSCPKCHANRVEEDRRRQESRGVSTNFDKAHGPFPDHVDMTQPLKGRGGPAQAHKIRVDKFGNIITDDIT